MGIWYSSDELIGRTIVDAEQFIVHHRVYYPGNNYRVLELRVLRPNVLYSMDYCYNRLKVRCDEDGKIVEICGYG